MGTVIKYRGNSFLLEQSGEQGIALRECVNSCDCVEIPESVSALLERCFLNTHDIKTLVIHDGIQSFEPDCFLGLDSLRTLSIELNSSPETQTRFNITLPPSIGSFSILRRAFDGGTLDIEHVYDTVDKFIQMERTPLERDTMMLNRLSSPVMLSNRNQAFFEMAVRCEMRYLCAQFCKRGYVRGLTQMVDCGAINENNISMVLDIARKQENVEAIGYLLEVSRHFTAAFSREEYEL